MTTPTSNSGQEMTVAEWVDTYYKTDRLTAEPGRRERIIADREGDLSAHGRAIISHHDSVTGRTEYLSL